MHIKRVSSVEEFVTAATQLRQKWMELGDPVLPWFRGQENAEWDLTPRFYRTTPVDLVTEWEIREEFITRAPALCDNEPRNEWEWYFLMQHYGTPTRLLDWTDGALIALYFAVRNNNGDYDAAVWALDPWWLNKKVIRIEEVNTPGDPLILPRERKIVERWLPRRFDRTAKLPRMPVAVFPVHFDKRIGAQRSSFTIHGAAVDGLTRLAEGDKNPGLMKYVIPSWQVMQIRRALDTCGIDETTIFPDLEALSRVLASRWKDSGKLNPHRGVYARLRPSKIHGVGVFAIRNIRKGTELFAEDLDQMVWIKQEQLKGLPKQVKKLYEDFAVLREGRLGCPGNFNRLTVSWYLNESSHPNVKCDQNYNFMASRDIKVGEELTVDYSSYSEPQS